MSRCFSVCKSPSVRPTIFLKDEKVFEGGKCSNETMNGDEVVESDVLSRYLFSVVSFRSFRALRGVKARCVRIGSGGFGGHGFAASVILAVGVARSGDLNLYIVRKSYTTPSYLQFDVFLSFLLPVPEFWADAGEEERGKRLSVLGTHGATENEVNG